MTTTDRNETRSGAQCPAPITSEDLISQQFKVQPEPFWGIATLRGDDGYDRMERARPRGWAAIPSWGRDGWDLGSWPYVVISHRNTEDGYELAYNVEGDITVYRYPTAELRDRATDYLAFWHWKHAEEPWVEGVDNIDMAPKHLRGPFSWKRLEQTKEEC